MKNVDAVVEDGFGREWSAFDQSSLATEEHLQLFDFPMGCAAAGGLELLHCRLDEQYRQRPRARLC
jgi:hypothetical protein